jgi:hypothetical protein
MNLNWRVGAAFGLGVAAGMVLREAVQRTQSAAQRKLTHRERELTVSYDENLPETLERREPAPREGQPRFGGTGAIGFPPAAAINPSDT